MVPTTGIPCALATDDSRCCSFTQGLHKRLHTELGKSWGAALQPLCCHLGSPGKGRQGSDVPSKVANQTPVLEPPACLPPQLTPLARAAPFQHGKFYTL